MLICMLAFDAKSAKWTKDAGKNDKCVCVCICLCVCVCTHDGEPQQQVVAAVSCVFERLLGALPAFLLQLVAVLAAHPACGHSGGADQHVCWPPRPEASTSSLDVPHTPLGRRSTAGTMPSHVWVRVISHVKTGSTDCA